MSFNINTSGQRIFVVVKVEDFLGYHHLFSLIIIVLVEIFYVIFFFVLVSKCSDFILYLIKLRLDCSILGLNDILYNSYFGFYLAITFGVIQDFSI